MGDIPAIVMIVHGNAIGYLYLRYVSRMKEQKAISNQPKDTLLLLSVFRQQLAQYS